MLPAGRRRGHRIRRREGAPRASSGVVRSVAASDSVSVVAAGDEQPEAEVAPYPTASGPLTGAGSTMPSRAPARTRMEIPSTGVTRAPPCGVLSSGATRPMASACPPTVCLRGEHDTRARRRVRSRVVVTQRDAQPPADVGQLRRSDPPPRAGELHRAGEPRSRGTQPVAGATGVQHAAVETRVVGGDERRVVNPAAERRPQIGEGRRVAHVVPAQTVEAGEREPCDRRPDQVGSGQDDPAAAAGGETDRAGAVAADGGGLEVDRDERGGLQHPGGRRRSPNRG